jgi:hypothetical protein
MFDSQATSARPMKPGIKFAHVLELGDEQFRKLPNIQKFGMQQSLQNKI